MSMLNRGVEMIAPAPHFDPKMALAAIEKYKCDLIIGVPTMYMGNILTRNQASRHLISKI